MSTFLQEGNFLIYRFWLSLFSLTNIYILFDSPSRVLISMHKMPGNFTSRRLNGGFFPLFEVAATLWGGSLVHTQFSVCFPVWLFWSWLIAQPPVPIFSVHVLWLYLPGCYSIPVSVLNCASMLLLSFFTSLEINFFYFGIDIFNSYFIQYLCL